ncbi:SDR family oxidoreductase [Brachybacterium sacelli]|uniref:SDR family oxidoreductase n=1 Tax=Brachybacterium sacelli TaxID=173364 RepID=UPI00361FB8CA
MAVRALVRHPLTAGLPAEVTMIEGTLQDPGAVRQAATGADSAFLLWIGDDPAEIPPVIDALTSSVRHVVYLSAADLRSGLGAGSAVQPGIHAEVERVLEASPSTWTFLRGGGFAANTLEWAGQIRAGDTVSVVHPGAGRSLVDERDLGEAAVRALRDPSLVGRALSLTARRPSPRRSRSPSSVTSSTGT